MAILVATSVLSAGFGLILRAAQRRGSNLLAVGLVNYLFAAAVSAMRGLAQGASLPAGPEIAFGAIIGLVYAIDCQLYVPMLRARGVSVTMAMARVSIVVPLIASIVLWREPLTGWGTVGAALALLALPLLVVKPGMAEGLSRQALLFGVALFAGTGAERTLMKAFQVQSGGSGDAGFFAVLFGSAAVVMLVAWLSRDSTFHRRDLAWGVALGLWNALANLTLLAALRGLPGVLVFPAITSVSLVCVALIARAAWRDRITRLEAGGMSLALAAVALAYLR